MLLGLDRISVGNIDEADDGDGRRLDLEGLTLSLRPDERTGDNHRRAGGEAEDFGRVIRQGRGCDALNRVEA